MRQKRQIAPWQRKGLEKSTLDPTQPKVAEAISALAGKPAIYHIVSRIVNGDRVLGCEEREKFVHLMRRYAAFSEVRIRTFCVMSNHFHILLEVPEGPEDRGASWSDERLMEHLSLIYNEKKLAELRSSLALLRSIGDHEEAEEFRARFFARMWDLSEYMKIVLQCFTQWFNGKHGRHGVLWQQRFKSELVEDGHAARRVAAYIDLNPVRAGLVRDPKDWRWSGYGEAVAGKNEALEGLQQVVFEEASMRMNKDLASRQAADRRKVLRAYRMALFADGQERATDKDRKRAGIARERVEKVLSEGGRLSEAELLLCRTRYFIDGVAIGSERFVNQVFALMRGSFGTQRKTGARRMRRVESTLRTLRDLQKDALRC